MRGIRTSVLFFMVFGGLIVQQQLAAGQQYVVNQTNPGLRDASAIASVQRAFAALGGTTSIASVQSLESKGQILRTGATAPIAFRWLEVVSGSSFEFRRETTDAGVTRVFASGHGNPGFGVSGVPGTRLSQHMVIGSVPLEMPAVLLYAEFQDPAYAFVSIASSVAGNLTHIRITNNSNMFMKAIVQQDWYFDPQTSLPVRIEYNLPFADDALSSMRAACVYGNYATIEGVLYPTSIQFFEQNQPVSQVAISSTQPNISVSNSEINISLVGQSAGGTN